MNEQCINARKRIRILTRWNQAGKGLVKVNGKPLNLVQPEILRFKVYEPLLIVGLDKFANVDIRVRVSGGGHTSQVYAIRQAISKSIVAYYQKFVDEHSKNALKQALVQYDRTLLVADNRRCEPKKFGGWFICLGRIGRNTNAVYQVPEPEPDTKSRTVKGWIYLGFGIGRAVSRAFAMDGLLYLLVVGF